MIHGRYIRHTDAHTEVASARTGPRRRWLSALSLVVLFALTAGSAQAAQNDVDLVSRASGAAGEKGNQFSTVPALSGDGRFVAFASFASNLTPDGKSGQVFMRDTQTGITTLVSRGSGATGAAGNFFSDRAAVSSDGRFVAFESSASNLDPADNDLSSDVYVRDRETNRTTLVSRASGASGAKGRGNSVLNGISGDGRYVLFSSDAANLSPDDGDTNVDVFVRDLQENTTRLVSRATGPGSAKANGGQFGGSQNGKISPNGRFVAFDSDATNLSPDDTDPGTDVYARDLATGTTTLVSRSTGAGGATGNGTSFAGGVSDNGRVAFTSIARLSEDDGDGRLDAYVRDLQANTTTLVSRASAASGVKGDGHSIADGISGDGRLVAFESQAANLSPDDKDGGWDVYLSDLQTNTTTLISRAAGASGAHGNGPSNDAALSSDGRFVAFDSAASNLSPADGDTVTDVFRRQIGDDRPAASADAYTAAESTSLTVAAPGVLANDSDPDADQLNAALASGPAHGTVSLNADGSFTYIPTGGYHGPDSFSYQASDGTLDSSAVPVDITVNAAPPKPRVMPLCQGQRATIVGTPGPDALRGTPHADVIVALGGNDLIIAGGGNDHICAGSGIDRVQAGAGNDRIDGGRGNDRLYGGLGNDRLYGGDGNDRMQGGRGRDGLFGGAGADRLYGGPGKDLLRGGAGRNLSVQ